jgi:hypothetical protein
VGVLLPHILISMPYSSLLLFGCFGFIPLWTTHKYQTSNQATKKANCGANKTTIEKKETPLMGLTHIEAQIRIMTTQINCNKRGSRDKRLKVVGKYTKPQIQGRETHILTSLEQNVEHTKKCLAIVQP